MPGSIADPVHIRRPLPGLTAALAGGILLAGFPGEFGRYPLLILLLVTVSGGIMASITKRPFWFIVTLLSLTGSLGFLRLQAQVSVAPNDISHLAPTDIELGGIVDSDVQDIYADAGARRSRVRFTLRVTSVKTASADQIVDGEFGRVDVSVPVTMVSLAARNTESEMPLIR